MKLEILLCISIIVCSHATTTSTTSPSTTSPTLSTTTTISTATNTSSTTLASTTNPASTTTPASTTNPASTLADQHASPNITSTIDVPVLTVNQYDHILESARKGLCAFTLDFQKCALNASGTKKNVLFSPVNVAGILATLLLGAEGDTKTEILKAVGISAGEDLSQKENRVHLALGSLFENFTSEAHDNPATTVEIAQSIFLQNGTTVKDFFRNFSQTVYKNEIVEIDFSNPRDEAADIINKWINNRTNNRIDKLIEPPLAKNTKMILTNSLFFNGEWEFPFLNETSWRPFYADTGNYSVKMMINIGPAYELHELGRNYSVLGLPYKGRNVIMYIILPKKQQSLENVLLNLKTEDIADIAAKSELVEDLSYSVPFMSINDDIHLNGILETIGIKSVFNPAKANLSNIADNIFVSQIIHRVNLDVTEAGSTGAASTVAQIETKFPKEPFIVDRPFLCYVYHRSSGLISFAGTVNLPVPNKTL